jgi:8-oxo-dGTP pyrophosphatase MutT (NUDIX family)
MNNPYFRSNYDENLSRTKNTYSATSELNIICAGGFIFDISNSAVLIVKGPSKWSLPKGHLEPNEHPSMAAVREIYEETSLIIDIPNLNRSKKLRKCIYYYVILKDADKFKLDPIDKKEVSDIKWIKYEELVKLDCNKHLKYFINNWSTVLKTLHEHQSSISINGKRD